MSRQLINEYRGDLDRLRAVSGSRRETVLREAFKDLLKRWGRTHDLQFIPEHDIVTPQKNRIYLDGALLHALRVPFGYWEAKDVNDNLDAEIASKSRKGYPRDNIIYSDDHTAVLIQDGYEVARVAMDDADELYPLLVRFFAHERQEIADFNKAVKQFSHDLPAVLEALRDLIAKKRKSSKSFAAAEKAFLQHAQEAINPAVTDDDVQEMLIQHILTEDIFAKVFDNPEFHRQNNVASALYSLEDKLFARGEKTTLLRALSPYYSGIAQTAAVIQSHSEKQGFLKGLYENFYKVYNAKAADRLGVVYTPGEIVRFMIRTTDWLCEKYFGKNLIDNGVEILDPATGTGTFIVELLEHFRGDRKKLRHKYKEELHANEIAILPYYVANLNIEATYQAITGQFAEFENLCFVDTLDNTGGLGIHSGHQFDLLGSLTDENIERIKRQNRRKISVIIGNPPYNANQQNENDNNKNRAYLHIDRRIKDTYIKESTAQKTKLYDMYARFYRWASDRLGDEGVLAFVTNRSFVDSRTFDGFRKLVTKDFQHISIIDLGGDVRANPKLSGTKHNVFGIQTGIAIAFLVRTKNSKISSLSYSRRPEEETSEDKLSWLSTADLPAIEATLLRPNARGDWLGVEDRSLWEAMLPIVDPASKVADARDRAIFRMFSNGLVTARDEWMISETIEGVRDKADYFGKIYNDEMKRWHASAERSKTKSSSERAKVLTNFVKRSIKWTSELEAHIERKSDGLIADDQIIEMEQRPFTRRYVVFHPVFTHRPYRQRSLFRNGEKNSTITFLSVASNNELATLACDRVFDYGLLKTGNGGTQGAPRYRYAKSGERIDNISDWAFNKFVKQYGKKGVTKDTIFHYVYAVLHDPIYRETYALNLKREFPRIPFYLDFAKWAAWGKTLMDLHIGYQDVEPWPIKRIETRAKRAVGTHPKPVLKSQPELGVVVIDADTQLSGIPLEAWNYRLGSRSAIDWILDQHKEKRPRDVTIASKFKTYRFADYKESMIELLQKIVRVSVETVEITAQMTNVRREN